MTYQPKPTPEEVWFSSGHAGAEQMNFINNMPDEAVSSTSGSGSVTTGPQGADVSVGSTSGDVARIEAADAVITSSGGYRMIFYVTSPDQNWDQLSGEIAIGAVRDDPTDTLDSVYYDPANDEYAVEDQTKAGPGITQGSGQGEYVIIEVDYSAGETTFYVPGHDSGTTFNVTPGRLNPNRITIESTGTAIQMNILLAAWTPIIDL